jgi:hypothetical protein
MFYSNISLTALKKKVLRRACAQGKDLFGSVGKVPSFSKVANFFTEPKRFFCFAQARKAPFFLTVFEANI